MRALVLTIASCILTGCGTAPPESAPTGPSAALAAQPATQDEAAQSAAPANKDDAFKPPAGYKTKIAGWDVVYCKKTAVLGTRFPKEVCMTEAELKAYLARSEDMRDDIDSAGRICSQQAGCASR